MYSSEHSERVNIIILSKCDQYVKYSLNINVSPEPECLLKEIVWLVPVVDIAKLRFYVNIKPGNFKAYN